ncbi:MAG: alpha/beta hydrolase [Pseudomonadota bacterium]|jgi:pimeloyl-ACP methyl ester carboxylesterase
MASNDKLPMRNRSVQCLGPHGLHRMAYTEWGDSRNKRVLICVHGLSRNGRDFDFLASRLCGHYRVVCPDVVGRGGSDWLPVKDDYAIPTYVNDMVTLIARLDVEEVHWVGTSMGGLIGMTLASLPGNPITRLVLNDVGPVITAVSIKRLGEYLGRAPTFASFEEAERYVRTISAPFGALSDEQWRHLTENVVRPGKDGGYEMHYDPGIAEPFRKAMSDEDVSLWPVYDAVCCPTLVVRGAQSDLLTAATVAEMARRGPAAQVVEIADVGHAPMFLDDMQVGIVRDFLLNGQTS